ncbi:MAG: OsmC family protein, partial [Planctomycetota bacterium]
MAEAVVTWTSGKQFVAESGSGHGIVLDAPAQVGGRNTGPTPMELLLMGLAGCTGIDVAFILGDRMKKP